MRSRRRACGKCGEAERRVPGNREHLDSRSEYIQILAVPETARDRNLSAADRIGIGFKNVHSGIGEGPGSSGVIVMTVSQENRLNVLRAATESFKRDPNRACIGIYRGIDQPVASISEFKKIRPDCDGSQSIGDNRDPPVGKLRAILQGKAAKHQCPDCDSRHSCDERHRNGEDNVPLPDRSQFLPVT